MADQATGAVETGGARGTTTVSTALGTQHLEHNPGRPVSWIGVIITVAGAIIGGAGFIPHMTWWLFWTGVAVTIVGLLVLVGAKTFSKDWY